MSQIGDLIDQWGPIGPHAFNGVTMPFLSTMTVGFVSGALLTTEIQNTGPIVDAFELQRLQTEFPGVGTWYAPTGD